jgi:hypothetical protein
LALVSACRALCRLALISDVVVQLSAWRSPPRHRVRGAIKIKFNYLNCNLMVPEIHSFSLSVEFSSKPKVKAANIRS